MSSQEIDDLESFERARLEYPDQIPAHEPREYAGKAHSKLLREIREWCAQNDYWYMGNISTGDGRSDATVISYLVRPDRKIWLAWVEAKTGTAKQSKKQKYFQEVIEASGGVYVVIYSKSEFLGFVKKMNKVQINT